MAPLDEKWVPKAGKDGFIIPRRGQGLFVQNGPLRCRWTYEQASMQMLAGGLAMLLGSPVTDATGLDKKYDLSLTFRTAGTVVENGPGLGMASWAGSARQTDLYGVEAVPDIFGAVQSLGLKLESKKTPKETIVIDHIEKLPTDN